jgi:hypothetical protein
MLDLTSHGHQETGAFIGDVMIPLAPVSIRAFGRMIGFVSR